MASMLECIKFFYPFVNDVERISFRLCGVCRPESYCSEAASCDAEDRKAENTQLTC